jgi:hypothetical protein
MGWLYQNDPVEDPVAYLIDKYNCDGHTRTWLVLAAARVSNTVYMAIKSTDKASAAAYVFAPVILISNTKKHGFGYKDIYESVGPCQCDCPGRIMRLLTPIADLPNPGYAAGPEVTERPAGTHKRARRTAEAWQLREYNGLPLCGAPRGCCHPTPASHDDAPSSGSFGGFSRPSRRGVPHMSAYV